MTHLTTASRTASRSTARRRGLRLFAATAAVSLALAGCGTDDDPVVDTSPTEETSTPEETTSPSEDMTDGETADGTDGEMVEGSASIDVTMEDAMGDGDWGSFTFGDGGTYTAIARGCDVEAHSEGGGSVLYRFDLVDGETKTSYTLDLITQNGEEYDVQMRLDGSDEVTFTGLAEYQSEDMDHTFATGTFTDGGDFSFSLVIAGACES